MLCESRLVWRNFCSELQVSFLSRISIKETVSAAETDTVNLFYWETGVWNFTRLPRTESSPPQ